MKKILNWIIAQLESISKGNLYYFTAGLLLALFCLFVLKMYVCFWPVMVLAFIIEFARSWSGAHSFNWWAILASVLGSFAVQVFVWLCLSPGVPFIVS